MRFMSGRSVSRRMGLTTPPMPTAQLQTTHPRISINQLGEFVFATNSKKYRILRDQKFGNKITSPYYRPAENAILRAFNGRVFDPASIAIDRSTIEQKEAIKPQQLAKRANNSMMLTRFMEIEAAARPVDGEHRVVRQNEKIVLDGVTVSVRPEIVTTCDNGLFSYTKFRFSKSEVSADSSEIILLTLLKFGQEQSRDGRQLDPEHTKLIDCFNRNVIFGHTLPRVREHQLAMALREIVAIWPTITPPPSGPLDDLQLAG